MTARRPGIEIRRETMKPVQIHIVDELRIFNYI
jgi:hypothetical protein